MPRRYHSPSSIKLVARCAHAAALRYIDGLTPPRVTWADVCKADAAGKGGTIASRDRSTALGTEVHARAEAWYEGRDVDWQDLPGQVLLSGAHLLPHPKQCFAAIVEEPLGQGAHGVDLAPRVLAHDIEGRYFWCDTLPECDAVDVTRDAAALKARGEYVPVDDAPTRGIEIHGVIWSGFRDLLAHLPDAECSRLGVNGPWLLIDHKTSADVGRYALTRAELLDDVQASLYAVDACLRLNVGHIAARWVYYETKRVRRSKAVDVVLGLDVALDVMRPAAELAKEFDSYTTSAEAPKNPAACGDYGGCPYHISAGGPCDARRSVGALIQARVRKTPTPPEKDPQPMALNDDVKNRFARLRNGGAAATTTPTASTDATPAETAGATSETIGSTDATAGAQASHDDATANDAAPSNKGTRSPRSVARAGGAKAAPSGPIGDVKVARVLDLQTTLRDAQSEVEAAIARRDGVLAQLRDAVA